MVMSSARRIMTERGWNCLFFGGLSKIAPASKDAWRLVLTRLICANNPNFDGRRQL
jgi:hypothetical protein